MTSFITDVAPPTAPSREELIHLLYEASELEHTLMCTYLYAAFSLKGGDATDLSPVEADAVARWRRAMLTVAIEEMGHLTAVWNLTAALGGAPRFGRGNFPLDPGALPAGMVVRLAPFSAAAVQHFIHLERSDASLEPEGEGFAPPGQFSRIVTKTRLTPMAVDYETVGQFYLTLEQKLRAFVALHGEARAFCGDPLLQLSRAEVELNGAQPVLCLKTAMAALDAIVQEGEGAPEHSSNSHFARFVAIRAELLELTRVNPKFVPAHPAAHNPVLRPPIVPTGRVWIEDERAAQTVDLANAAYALMLRLLGHAYLVPRPSPIKALSVDLSLGLMRAVTHLAERAARLPAGASSPGCNAGMSFTALRDAAALPPGEGANHFFIERFAQLAAAAESLNQSGDARTASALRIMTQLAERAARGFVMPRAPAMTAPAVSDPEPAPASTSAHGVETVEGKNLTVLFEGRKCIHARFCVTQAPKVFLANVQGPWIHPDAMPLEALVGVAHACPSGAIRYRRKDGQPDESAPPVNVIAVREAGPYAVRAELHLDGQPAGYRATLCRCGASRHKPYCDGSHHEVDFSASGEPPTQEAGMLEVRDGALHIDPEVDGPLVVRGNLEITSGTGRMVTRLVQTRLCRCGGSARKPFCDGAHARIGFKSA